MNTQFWRDKRVLVTGHTGFKGSWLSLWLQKHEARIIGYALPPPSEALFNLAGIGEHMDSVFADIRDYDSLQTAIARFRPEIVFHLAAQPLVRRSYVEPVETYAVNVIGTVHLLEALRRTRCCRVVVNVTSDKCYENNAWTWGYRECDHLGGHDPYSSSKGCSELITAAYRRSFFEADGVAVATARAGNVIGGGDFSADRIIPDFMVAARSDRPLQVRNPDAIRPWQHVLEPLLGYLLLAEKMFVSPTEYAEGWNFGPTADDVRPVRWIVETLNNLGNRRISWHSTSTPQPHEAQILMLDSTKARLKLDWKPRWTLEQGLCEVSQWYEAHEGGKSVRDVTLSQIANYERSELECTPFARRAIRPGIAPAAEINQKT